MNNFKRNLKYLRTTYGFRQDEIAKVVNKLRSTIGNWETGLSQPNLEELITLADFFDTRLDILVLAPIEKEQLISEKQIAAFHKKGKLNKPIEYDTTQIPSLNVEEEGQEINLSQVMDELKNINDNIGKIRSEIKKTKKA